MPDREVYPHAPLILVALEIRHPATASPSALQQAEIKRTLAKWVPLATPLARTAITATPGRAPEMAQSTSPRFTSRDRTTSVTFNVDSLHVETTRYRRFEDFFDLAEAALVARSVADLPDGIERVGLRYIDEIRVPDTAGGQQEWSEWLDPSLLGPRAVADRLKLSNPDWQGLAVFKSTPDDTQDDSLASLSNVAGDTLAVRYGPGNGYALDPGSEPKRSAPPPGPFFLLDIDSFWIPVVDVPAFDRDAIAASVARLHEPVRVVFESLITDRLRNEVLRDAS